MSQTLTAARREAAPDSPASTPWAPGDSWFGRALNKLVPILERNGFRVAEGTVDFDDRSFVVRHASQSVLVEPRANEDVHLRLIDDPAPSDQFPVLALYRGEEGRHEDLDRIDAIVHGFPCGVDPND